MKKITCQIHKNHCIIKFKLKKQKTKYLKKKKYGNIYLLIPRDK